MPKQRTIRLGAPSGPASNKDAASPTAEVRPSHVARAYAPVLQWFLGAAACYYAIIAVSHLCLETGSTLAVLVTLATAGCLWPLHAWLRIRRAPDVSLGWLEVTAAVTYGLFALNVSAHQLLDFHSERLVYFVFMAMVFGVTAPSPRVAYAAIGVALLTMAAFGLRMGPEFLEMDAFIGLAGGFAAVGMTRILRGVVMREIRARILSEDLLVEAQSATRAKSAFLATISHEFRTPLNAVLGMTQIMRREPLPERHAAHLEIIQREADALRQMLDDILDIVGLEANGIEPRPQAFDLEAFGQGLDRLYRLRVREKGLNFTIEVRDAGAGRCVGDEGRLRQIAASLVSNAIKFTPSGAIHVCLDATDDTVTLRVEDTGVGIPPEAQTRIFEPFSQLEDTPTRTVGGAGLGLAICRRFVALLGGTIEVSSVSGAGTSFTVRLPIGRAGVEAVSGADVAPGGRALVVDDNATNRLVLRTLLDSMGIACELVENGFEAIQAAERDAWDVIFMDIHMPKMDGVSAAREIRLREARERRCPTPIIAVTASVSPTDLANYAAAGIDRVLAKPLAFHELAAALRETRSGNEPQTAAPEPATRAAS